MENNKKILLKDVLQFDDLQDKFPNREIKLRFNKNWEHEHKGVNFAELYVRNEGHEKFRESLLTISKPKRIKDNDIIFQFIEIKTHKWLLVDVHKIISSEPNGDIAEAKTMTEYEQYFGRLIVDFKNLPQQFYYTAREIVDNVEVSEITEKHYLETK